MQFSFSCFCETCSLKWVCLQIHWLLKSEILIIIFNKFVLTFKNSIVLLCISKLIKLPSSKLLILVHCGKSGKVGLGLILRKLKIISLGLILRKCKIILGLEIVLLCSGKKIRLNLRLKLRIGDNLLILGNVLTLVWGK